MLKFIAKLFATPPAVSTPNPKTRLSVDALETREAPALLVNPGVLRGFNPQPDPPGVTAGIIAINPGIVRLPAVGGG